MPTFTRRAASGTRWRAWMRPRSVRATQPRIDSDELNSDPQQHQQSRNIDDAENRAAGRLTKAARIAVVIAGERLILRLCLRGGATREGRLRRQDALGNPRELASPRLDRRGQAAIGRHRNSTGTHGGNSEAFTMP